MAFVKRENLCTVEIYGENKKKYNKIGEIVTFSGNNGDFQKVKLFHLPGVEISVFPEKKDDNLFNG